MTVLSRTNEANNHHSRIEGLDLARFFAFAGMVIVNFKIVMGVVDNDGVLALMTRALEGRAAATFVVLAGVGLGLAAQRRKISDSIVITTKRAALLLLFGLLNMIVFDADILHFYAFYFLIGVWFLRLNTAWLLVAIFILNASFLVMILLFNYDQGWNWADFTYVDIWTLAGFGRHLFFNGWHPVIPWLSFLLFGLTLARIQLTHKRTQNLLVAWGIGAILGAELLSHLLTNWIAQIDIELIVLAATEPVPPMPLYILAGCGAASLIIGLCLRYDAVSPVFPWMKHLLPAGRQTLTLYVAHILLGMGVLESLGMLSGQTLMQSITSSFLFCTLAVVYALIWSRFFKYGPLESVMRRLAG